MLQASAPLLAAVTGDVEEALTLTVGVTFCVQLEGTAAVIKKSSVMRKALVKCPELVVLRKHQVYVSLQVVVPRDVGEGLTATVGVTHCVRTEGTAAVTCRRCVARRTHTCLKLQVGRRMLGRKVQESAGVHGPVQAGVEGEVRAAAGVTACVQRGETAAVTGLSSAPLSLGNYYLVSSQGTTITLMTAGAAALLAAAGATVALAVTTAAGVMTAVTRGGTAAVTGRRHALW